MTALILLIIAALLFGRLRVPMTPTMWLKASDLDLADGSPVAHWPNHIGKF